MSQSNKMSLEEYRREVNRVHSSRHPNSVLPNNTKGKTRKQAVQKVQGVQRMGSGVLHAGPFRICVEIHGKCRGDIDNVLKGILDSLNGVAYKDDKQCVEARVKLCESEGDL